MPRELVSAHDVLDKAVDGVFGFRRVPTELERQARLFERYLEMSSDDQLSMEEDKPKRKRRK
jgi:hypothetical protein